MLKKVLAIVLAVIMIAASVPADAGGRHRRHHDRGGGAGVAVLGLLFGGALLGALGSRSYGRGYYRGYGYPSYPVYLPPWAAHCRQYAGVVALISECVEGAQRAHRDAWRRAQRDAYRYGYGR